MSKFSFNERNQIKDLVATLSLKRISDEQIIEFILGQTNKTITSRSLRRIRQRLKVESFNWYSKMRESRYEYIHEFRSLMNDIIQLQKRCHELIESNKNNPQVQLSAIAELHRLNVAYSNYVEIIPNIIGNSNINGTTPVPINAQGKTVTTETEHSTITV